MPTIINIIENNAWTPVSGVETRPVTSITRAGAIATVTTPVPHGQDNLSVVAIAGADQAEYNGDVVITVLTLTTFSYTVTGTPDTPATGTITLTATFVTVGPRDSVNLWALER